jgi:hypothetical protein
VDGAGEMPNNFYVYVLFDWLGIPRYVGKGKGDRWLIHERRSDPSNQMKNEFIEQTWFILGEVPKVKIQENLTSAEACKLEIILIETIGRLDLSAGPLTNMSKGGDGGPGPSSLRMIAWHASRTPEERSASARKVALRMTPEQLSTRGRNNALSVGREELSRRMALSQASRSPEERYSNALKGGLASKAKTTSEQKRAQGLKGLEIYMTTTTPKERRANARRSGVGQLTKEQLSQNGKRGVAIANGNRTPEERSALARKAALAGAAKRKNQLL